MADRTLTVNGQPFTFNRDRFAGVRTMTSGHVYPSSQFKASNSTSYWSATATAGTDGTEWRLISNLANDGAFNFGTLMLADNTTASKVRVGKHRVEFDLTLNSGDINDDSNIGSDGFYLVTRDHDDDPSGSEISTTNLVSVGSNSIDVEVFDDGDDTFLPTIFLSARPDSVFDVTVSNLKVTHNYEEITVDRTAPSGVSTLTGGHVYPTIFNSSYSSNGVNFTKTDEETFSLVASNSSGNFNLAILRAENGIRRGKHRITCDVIVNSGSISSLVGYYSDPDNDPAAYNHAFFNFVEGSNVIDFEIFDDGDEFGPQLTLRINPESTCDISVTNFKITQNYEEITVDSSPSDRVGESRPLLSKVVGGASAAYSLRDLNDKQGNNKVVRVRRASDNHERDFLAKEVSNGTLKNWVNTQTVLPLDLQALTADGRTGSVIPAKAAYSLRNLSKNYTGNVVDVRRFTDGATNSYTADEITGGALTSFANESVKYLDSTGNTASNGRVTYNGYGHSLVSGSTAGASFSTTGGFNNTEKYSFTGGGDNGSFGHNWYLNNSFNVANIGSTGTNKTVTIEAYVKRTSGSSGDNLYFRPYAQQNTSNKVTVTGLVQDEWTFVKGTLIKDPSLETRHHIQIGGDTGVTFEVSNIKFYSENNDVTVSKWYDQSGNGNDALQPTAGSQPKIVSAGALLADGLTFDGSDDVLFTTSAISSTNIAIACVSKSGDNGTAGIISMLDGINDGHELLYLANKIRLATNNDDLNVTAAITNQNLYFANYDGSTQTLSVNGTASTASSNRTISVTQLAQIGQRRGGSSLVGSIEELIIYDSDQTANRTAIEANIGEAYSITGIPAYDNTVDGFVETWYDQSGNTNHAVQATAASQPKIVNAGSLVTLNNKPSLEFDGVDDSLFTTAFIPNHPLTLMAVSQLVDGNSLEGGIVSVTSNYDSYHALSANNSAFYFTTRSPNIAVALNLGATTDPLLITGIKKTASSAEGFKDGTSAGTLTGTTDNWTSNFLLIGALRFSGSNTNLHAQVFSSEIIVYNSDQSVNRPAIEANIKNQYEIS